MVRVDGGAGRHYLQPSRPASRVPSPLPSPGHRKAQSKADRILGRDPNLYVDDPVSPGLGAGQQDVNLRRLSPAGRTVEDELEEIDNEIDEEEQTEQVKQEEIRARKERIAMNVVTNGRWGAGARSPLLISSPRLGQGGSGTSSPRREYDREDDDDGVD